MPPTQSTGELLAPASLSVGSFIKSGWETFKKRPWFFILAVIVFWLASFVINFIAGFIQAMVDGDATSGIGHLISFFVSNVGSMFVGIGMLAFFIKAHDAPDTVSFNDAWKPEVFWKYVGASILLGMIVIVGFVLLIVPGIIAAIALSQTLYLVVDRGLGPIEALKESARITKGNRWRLFAFGGASFLLTFAGLLCLIVGLLVVAPVLAIAGANAYRRISAAADAQAHTPLSGGEKAFAAVGILLPVIAIVGILAAVVLASLSFGGVSNGKREAAKNMEQLILMGRLIELYSSDKGQYPANLEEITSQYASTTDTKTDLSAYTYTTDAKHETYKLCTTAPVPVGQESCISSEDSTSTNAQ